MWQVEVHQDTTKIFRNIFAENIFWHSSFLRRKITTGIALPYEYFIIFSEEKEDVQHTLVFVKMHDVNTMSSSHYYCDLLDVSTGIWWLCNDKTVNVLTGLP